MPFVDTSTLEVVERRPGGPGATRFAQHDLRSLRVQRGLHDPRALAPQEEVWQVIEGELEIDVDGDVRIAGPGLAAIVPPNVRHQVRALTDGKAIIVDYPLRPDA